jgi:transcription elongation factor GreA
MDQNQFYLTPEGASKLRAELEDLQGRGREELAVRLRFAIQQGDLSENADYTVAKEEQAFLEGKILELKTILQNATVVDPDGSCEQVGIGNTVVVSIDGREPETFHIVGMKEANPRQRKISHESPIGNALIGKRVGELAEAETPGGKLKVKVLEIH